ncbi:helix-turn-helix domain-containing protein [Streptomyces cylindrosporus]|uniref:Helix-turn-helix domain-containing protein n=1 Tax=Streptomyces cylindrosporus TaxID=2927583 RepID=A0ABS9YK04_9ACTN|nr:helix-turn-helix domain-containing protein [Streptomyces cylindrosporus]MCI3277500.1 helix-turn-helix domain-containing protein [Streptomyces cylindrosporus]
MPAPLTIAARRAMVEELLRQEPGISARTIAARLGVGKDTIRRDLAAIEAAQRQAASEPAAKEPDPAPDAPAPNAVSAPRDPLDEPLRRWLTPEAHADLAVLMEAGHSVSFAVRRALEVLADAYRGAWDRDRYPRGTAPEITSISVAPYRQKGAER